jgi:hypothetical protein
MMLVLWQRRSVAIKQRAVRPPPIIALFHERQNEGLPELVVVGGSVTGNANFNSRLPVFCALKNFRKRVEFFFGWNIVCLELEFVEKIRTVRNIGDEGEARPTPFGPNGPEKGVQSI